MARHRAASARAATTPPPAAPTATPTPTLTPTPTRTRGTPDPAVAVPRQGLADAHPSGPLPRARPQDRSQDPDTSPLDLAAIALAAANARRSGPASTGTPPSGSPAAPPSGHDPTSGPVTGGTPRPPYPAAVPSALAPPTPAHAVPAVGRAGGDGGRRVPLPTRTAGALALVGALAGGGVAVVGGSTMLAADPTPTTGEIRTPDVATAAAQTPTDPGEQTGRHAADGARSHGGR